MKLQTVSQSARDAQGMMRILTPLLLLVLTMASVPVGILAHEGAHFITARAFGLPGVAFHSARVSYDHEKEFWQQARDGQYQRAKDIFPLRQIILVEFSGPLLSLVIIALCWGFSSRMPANPLLAALATVSSLRFLAPLDFLIRTWGQPRSSLPLGGNDEYHLALLTSIPLFLMAAVELVFCAIALTKIYGRLVRSREFVYLAIAPIGVVAGMAVFFSY